MGDKSSQSSPKVSNDSAIGGGAEELAGAEEAGRGLASDDFILSLCERLVEQERKNQSVFSFFFLLLSLNYLGELTLFFNVKNVSIKGAVILVVYNFDLENIFSKSFCFSFESPTEYRANNERFVKDEQFTK